ncbi:MAG: hypothetical protein L0Z73_06725, partial [Gammaproteobacteria bacterium]|nr:hypothetical protein [Gammaproteobacteria bacterium]
MKRVHQFAFLKTAANRKRGLFSIGTFLFGILIGISSTFADDKLELFYSYFSDSGGLDVTSPSFFISKDLSEKNTLGFMY